MISFYMDVFLDILAYGDLVVAGVLSVWVFADCV